MSEVEQMVLRQAEAPKKGRDPRIKIAASVLFICLQFICLAPFMGKWGADENMLNQVLPLVYALSGAAFAYLFGTTVGSGRKQESLEAVIDRAAK